MTILRRAVDGGPGQQSFSATVTRFDPGIDLDPALLRFTPPAGATEMPPAGTSCHGASNGSRAFDLPASFPPSDLRPERVLGWRVGVDRRLRAAPSPPSRPSGRRPAQSHWSERVRVDGLPAALRTGDRVSIAGLDGYAARVDGRERLAWYDSGAGVAAVLESDVAPLDELLRIARSTRPASRAPGPVDAHRGVVRRQPARSDAPRPVRAVPGERVAALARGLVARSLAARVHRELAPRGGERPWLRPPTPRTAQRRGSPVAPSWSPDGTRLAVMDSVEPNALPGAPTHILVVDVGTGAVRAMPATGAYDGGPAWSPDGRRLVFASTRDSREPDIFVMDAATGAATNLTPGPGHDINPAWLPDGRVAFFSERTGNWDLFVMDANGSSLVNLTDDPAGDFPGIAKGSVHAAASPDGSRVAFLSDHGGIVQVYVARTDGSGVTRVSHDANDDYAPQSPPTAGSSSSGRRRRVVAARSGSRPPTAATSNGWTSRHDPAGRGA